MERMEWVRRAPRLPEIIRVPWGVPEPAPRRHGERPSQWRRTPLADVYRKEATAIVGTIQSSGLFSAASSATISLSGVTAGNAIVVWGWHEGGGTAYTSITVTGGGTYTAGTPVTNGNRSVCAAATFSATGGATTVTVTFNGGTGGAYGEYFACEVSGGLTAFDQFGSSTGFTASPATATASAPDSGTDDFTVAAFSAGGGGAANAISSPCTGGATWTAAGVSNNDSSNASGQASCRVNASAVTDAATWTFATTPLVSGAAAGVWSLKTGSPPPAVSPPYRNRQVQQALRHF